MLILLPPSEGKTAPRRGKPLDLDSLSFPSLAAPRREVLESLVSLCTSGGGDDTGKAAAVLGLGPTQAEEVRRNADLWKAPTARADQVYSGVLYEALSLPTLDTAGRRRATSRVAVTSALFGLVRPTDRIPAYRLAGSVSLPGTGPLGTFWARHLDAAVREAAGPGLVVDLRSSTYASFWRPDRDLAAKVVGVRVLQETNGTRTVVSHFNKATKGRLVRRLLETGANPSTPHRLAATLQDLGWTVDAVAPTRHGSRIDVIVSDV